MSSATLLEFFFDVFAGVYLIFFHCVYWSMVLLHEGHFLTNIHCTLSNWVCSSYVLWLSLPPHPTSLLWFLLSCCIYIHNFKDLYKNHRKHSREHTWCLCSWEWWNWCDTILSNHILLPVSNMTSSFFRMKETPQCVFIPFPLLLDT